MIEIDLHYENQKLAELYDLDSPWSIDRDFYLALAGPPPQRILDLGCGTGLLCNAYAAKNHEVTGLDPSASMLKVASQKPHGKEIEWVQSFAQNFKSDKLFDLIIMTGHAFQVLLEDDDVLAVFSMVRNRLEPGGHFVFESRNPKIDWAKEWNYAIELQLPGAVVEESRRFLNWENDRMSFELSYQFPKETLSSTSKLRFLSKRQIEQNLLDSGLSIANLFGNWDRGIFDEDRSHEMIFIARTNTP